jgi:hypothetical protein
MPIDPNEPLTVMERHSFGHDATRHPITGMVLEKGSGAFLPKEQAYRVHLPIIAKTEGAAAAAAMRAALDKYYATHADTEPAIPRSRPAERPRPSMLQDPTGRRI